MILGDLMGRHITVERFAQLGKELDGEDFNYKVVLFQLKCESENK